MRNKALVTNIKLELTVFRSVSGSTYESISINVFKDNNRYSILDLDYFLS